MGISKNTFLYAGLPNNCLCKAFHLPVDQANYPGVNKKAEAFFLALCSPEFPVKHSELHYKIGEFTSRDLELLSMEGKSWGQCSWDSGQNESNLAYYILSS